MDTFTQKVTALAHDGRGIVRLPQVDDKPPVVVFVGHALPGQTVRATITRRKAHFWEARLDAVLAQATDAAPPICPHHAVCGGCPLQTMPYDSQLAWKRTRILDALERISGYNRPDLEALLPAVHPSPVTTRYRNKMEFAFGSFPMTPGTSDGPDGSGLLLGLRRRSGHAVTDVPHCAMVPEEALHMLTLVSEQAAASGLPAYRPSAKILRQGHTYRPRAKTVTNGFWRFLTVRRGLDADLHTVRWWVVCTTSPGSREQRAVVRQLGQTLLDSFPQLAAFIHEERATNDALALGQKRILTLGAGGRDQASACLHLPLSGKFFRLDAASFFQVNTAGAQTLAQQVTQLLPPPQTSDAGLLDIYCGVGAPGLLVANGYGRLLGLEIDRRATALAHDNAHRMGYTQCRYIPGDAAQLLRRPELRNQAWHTILLDPPRAGLDASICALLPQLGARRVLYISCNPATLARDMATLRRDFTLQRLAAVDLFPHTPHVETIALLERQEV